MKEKFINTKINVYSYNELADDDKKLVDLAKEATQRSYSPYSKFRVGAALLLSNGKIVTGSNQENIAFPSGTCAERTAIFYAHSQYPDEIIKKIAIAAYYDGDFIKNPVSPCGACRQAILEYENLGGNAIEVLLYGKDEVYVLEGIKTLLPLQFDEF